MISRFAIRLLSAALFALTIPASSSAARDATPGFVEQSLGLPGMPAAVLPVDMNGDDRLDLVVLVAYTAWGETATTEQMRFDDIEGLVEVMNVVSALVDRRELRVYLGGEGSESYDPRPVTLDLDASVHALSAGGAAEPLLALTDSGVAAVRLSGAGEEATLSMVPVLAAETVLSGSGTFYADFDFVHDLDRDGDPDLVLPTADGWSVFARAADGFTAPPASLLARFVPEEDDEEDDEAVGNGGPVEESEERTEEQAGSSEKKREVSVGRKKESRRERRERRKAREDSDSESDSDSDSDSEEDGLRAPLQPEVGDLNGDGRPDLLVYGRGRDPVAYVNRGSLDFSEPVELSLAAGHPKDEEIVFVGALTGGREAAVVGRTEVELPEDAGMRMEIDNAKRPDFSYAVYPVSRKLAVTPGPSREFQVEGYTFEGSDGPDDEVEIELPGGFQDLDGDGRLDLVAITLDFSILPLIVRALVTRSISLTMDFHPWCQTADGGFRRVPGLDLSGRFKINLRNVQVKHLSQFAGDFNGDGRADFVQLGRGRKVTIHHGGPGCTYPKAPSRSIKLQKEPRHLGLVRIRDLDGNGRSDLYVVHPLKDPKSGESTPVQLDLYLSEG